MKRILSMTMTASLVLGSAMAQALTVGFSQVGSESGWRTTFSNSIRAEAERFEYFLALNSAADIAYVLGGVTVAVKSKRPRLRGAAIPTSSIRREAGRAGARPRQPQ
jgi:hypothetical protein